MMAALAEMMPLTAKHMKQNDRDSSSGCPATKLKKSEDNQGIIAHVHGLLTKKVNEMRERMGNLPAAPYQEGKIGVANWRVDSFFPEAHTRTLIQRAWDEVKAEADVSKPD